MAINWREFIANGGVLAVAAAAGAVDGWKPAEGGRLKIVVHNVFKKRVVVESDYAHRS